MSKSKSNSNRPAPQPREPESHNAPNRPRVLTEAQRENLEKGQRRRKGLKMSRKAIGNRDRQRARRQREKESSPAAIQARAEAQEQEAFLREGGPRPGVARPSIIAAWHRAAKMTPQERRAAHAARQKRVEAAARASGLVKPWQSVFVSGPADGSGDLDDPDVWFFIEPKPRVRTKPESAYEPSAPAEDRDGLDVE